MQAKSVTPSPVAAPSEILTVQEVADMLKVPKSSIYEWTRYRGSQRLALPRRKVGKYIRFFRSEVLQWVAGLPQAGNMAKRAYKKQ